MDNFFYRDDADIRSVPGKRLLEFGEEVRRFTSNNDPTGLIHQEAQYLGGWPSADSLQVGSGVIRSSLLFTEQVLVKDQIADRFSNEIYQNEQYLSSAPEWLIPGEGPKIAETRAFLARVLPALREARPLIESGVMVLAPLETQYLQNESVISGLRDELAKALLDDPLEMARKFPPEQLAIHDGQRGMLAFAGGAWEEQTRKYFREALQFFAREYVSANAYGSSYCALFGYERFVCSQGLGTKTTKSDRVRECLISSELPAFSGLTSNTLSRIHSDEHFGEFRRQLYEIYSDAPVDGSQQELDQYIEEQENAMLRPILEKAKQDADRGRLSQLGVAVRPVTFQLLAGVAGGIVTGSPVLPILAGAATVVDQLLARKWDKSNVAWTALVNHNATAEKEMPASQQRAASFETPSRGGGDEHPWGIPAQASDSIRISRGTLHASWLPSLPVATEADGIGGYREGVYAPCPCGSTCRYKFCCGEIDRQYGIDSLQPG